MPFQVPDLFHWTLQAVLGILGYIRRKAKKGWLSSLWRVRQFLTDNFLQEGVPRPALLQWLFLWPNFYRWPSILLYIFSLEYFLRLFQTLLCFWPFCGAYIKFNMAILAFSIDICRPVRVFFSDSLIALTSHWWIILSALNLKKIKIKLKIMALQALP